MLFKTLDLEMLKLEIVSFLSMVNLILIKGVNRHEHHIKQVTWYLKKTC